MKQTLVPSPSSFVLSFVLFLLTCAMLFGAGVGLPYARAAQSVTLTWDPNIETNLAGYKVLWGQASGWYTRTNDMPGKGNVCVISNMFDNVTNYFVVVAYSFDPPGLCSDFSNEVAFFSKLPPPRLAPPSGVKLNLTAQIQGSWKLSGAPWTNLYGYNLPTSERFPFYRLKIERQ